MKRPSVLAATVGTSLRDNLLGVPEENSGWNTWLQQQPEGDRRRLEDGRSAVLRARRAAARSQWTEAGQALAELRDTARVAGAEACSIRGLLGEPMYEGVRRVFLLHSGTDEGRGCAEAIRAYLVASERVMAEPRVVEELQHFAADRFRVAGLRNLVRRLAEIARDHGVESMVVDGTGGYKAQIGVAAVFGQAFGVPVLYRFEAFDTSVELPPLPVKVDDSVVPEHLDLFRLGVMGEPELIDRVGRPLTEANEELARLRICLEGPETIDGVRYWGVSPVGEILYQRWLLAGTLSLKPATQQQPVRWGDHHKPPGLAEFAARLLREHQWIVSATPQSAAGRSGPDGVRVKLATTTTPVPPIECVYVKNNHPALLHLHTTAANRDEQEAALRELVRTDAG